MKFSLILEDGIYSFSPVGDTDKALFKEWIIKTQTDVDYQLILNENLILPKISDKMILVPEVKPLTPISLNEHLRKEISKVDISSLKLGEINLYLFGLPVYIEDSQSLLINVFDLKKSKINKLDKDSAVIIKPKATLLVSVKKIQKR